MASVSFPVVSRCRQGRQCSQHRLFYQHPAHSCEVAGALAGKLIDLNLGYGLSGWLSGERVPRPGVTGRL